MDCLYLLRCCSLCGLALLVGCTGSYYVPEGAEVYEGEYIVSYRAPSHGPFNKVFPREHGDPVFPTGTLTSMVQIERGSKEGLFLEPSQRVSALQSRVVPYSKEKDRCRGVEICSPNYVLRATTNDPYTDRLWGLQDPPGINVSVVEPRDTPDVKVMVLDTGVNCDHEDLTCGAVGFNAITGGETVRDARDDNGHGSHVSGTIGATGNNRKGITGTSTRADIIPGKFLDASGAGSLFDAIKAIRWAIKNDIDIINCSFGGGGYSVQFQSVVNEAASKGILVIAAAGNENNDNDKYPRYPSNYDNVLSVASHTVSGERSEFSNFGVDSVDVSAPGSGIYSVRHTGGYRYLDGTSMATPHVAGIAALLYQKYKELPKTERRELTIKAITESGRANSYTRWGYVDARAALEKDPVCRRIKCKNCFEECTDKYKCKCRKWRQCKKQCRETTKCGFGCQ